MDPNLPSSSPSRDPRASSVKRTFLATFGITFLISLFVCFLAYKTDIFIPTPVVIVNKVGEDTLCKQQLTQALEAIKEEQGYLIDIKPEDIDSLAVWGTIIMSYKRDGQKIGCGFKIVKKEEGCSLKHHYRSYSKPGEWSNEKNNFGTAKLPDCLCEKKDSK